MRLPLETASVARLCPVAPEAGRLVRADGNPGGHSRVPHVDCRCELRRNVPRDDMDIRPGMAEDDVDRMNTGFISTVSP